MKSKEEILYIRANVLPYVHKHLVENDKWMRGKCVVRGCNKASLPFNVFCEEHLGDSVKPAQSLASLFGFEHESVKTYRDTKFLEERLQEFAGFDVTPPKDPVDFVKTFFNISLFRYQQEFFKAFISLPKMKNEVVTALFVRQTGKNETIANAICYLLLNYRNMRIGIFAPTEKQAQAIGLQRVRERLTSNKFVRGLIKTDMKDLIILENGSFVRAFTANPNSQIEGFTLNIAVLDESQDITDHIVAHDIIPMLASTNGSIVKIGTAGGKNHFFRSCRANIERGKFHFQNNYLDVGKERPEYLNFVEEIAREMGGKESPEFRSQFLNEWVESAFAFVSEEQFNRCVINEIFENEPLSNYIYVAGLDLAKNFDEGVLTIVRLDKTNIKRVVAFYSWQGVKYTDMFKEVEKIYYQWRLSAIGVDCTKEDTFADLLEDAGLYVNRVRFTRDTRSNIYKLLLTHLESESLLFSSRGSEMIYHLRKMEKQITQLSKQWKNNTLIVETPSERYHDDYPDSLAIALYTAKDLKISYIPDRIVKKKRKEIVKNNTIERVYAKEYFGNGDVKKGKKVGFENFHKLLRWN